MRSELPSGTVTFLFTDVEGSTTLLSELGAEAYAEALAEHRRVIREACSSHDGVEVDTQGDAFFFAFPTAPGALAAAAAMTEALAPGPIQVRVGMHTGTPLLTEEGYIGDDVHFGARIAASSHGGQVVLSHTTAELVALPVSDLGEHRLKDIEGAVSIFQLGDGSFPPLKTISNTNLPRPASSFVGRDEELQEVLARIEGGARLVTLSGPGGTGKTRLALEAASLLVGEYKAGVFWIGLATLRDPTLVTETISQTLGAKDGLAEHIAEREMLLLLDNLEQVIESASELSGLLERCANLTLLVTSRELLRIQGEVEYAVPPLAEPEAVSLFCERAQLDPSEEIAELCSRLDSLPLAVELAAARAKALTPAQILERLSGRLDLLRGGRDADPRQQTLRATIEWSNDLLSHEEQQLFGRLSVFSGGCTLEAAEEVCEASLDTLQSLIEKNLVRFTNERYWMLETIREFAGERLAEVGEAQSVSTAHANYFCALSTTAEGDVSDAAPRQWLDCQLAELTNIRSAIEWLIVADTVKALALATALQQFWWVRAPAEGRTWVERTLTREAPLGLRTEAARALAGLAWQLDDRHTATRCCEEWLLLSEELGDVRQMVGALSLAASLAGEEGDATRSEEAHNQALDLARETGDPSLVCSVLLRRAELETDHGDRGAAVMLFEETLCLARSSGSEHFVAHACAGLGIVACHDARWEDARIHLHEALPRYHELGDTKEVAICLDHLGAVAAFTDDPERSARLLGAGAAAWTAIGVPLESAYRPSYVDEALTAARARLGNDPYAFVCGLGKAMSLEEAVAYALADLD